MDITGKQTKLETIHIRNKIIKLAQTVIKKVTELENKTSNIDENFLQHVIYYLYYYFGLGINEFNNFIYLGTIMGILNFLDKDDEFFNTEFKTIDDEYEELLILASYNLELLYCFLVLGGNGNLDLEFHLSTAKPKKIALGLPGIEYQSSMKKLLKEEGFIKYLTSPSNYKNIAIYKQLSERYTFLKIDQNKIVYGLMAAEVIPTHVINKQNSFLRKLTENHFKKLNVSLISILNQTYDIPKILENISEYHEFNSEKPELSWDNREIFEKKPFIDSNRNIVASPKIITKDKIYKFSLVLWRNPWTVVELSEYPEFLLNPSNVIIIQDRFHKIEYYQLRTEEFYNDFIKWAFINQYIYKQDGKYYTLKLPIDFISTVWTGEDIHAKEETIEWEELREMRGVYDCKMKINDQRNLRFFLWIEKTHNLYYISMTEQEDKDFKLIIVPRLPVKWFGDVINLIKSRSDFRKRFSILFEIPIDVSERIYGKFDFEKVLKIKKIL